MLSFIYINAIHCIQYNLIVNTLKYSHAERSGISIKTVEDHLWKVMINIHSCISEYVDRLNEGDLK